MASDSEKSVSKTAVGVLFILFGVLFTISYWMVGSPLLQEVIEVGINDTWATVGMKRIRYSQQSILNVSLEENGSGLNWSRTGTMQGVEFLLQLGGKPGGVPCSG